MLLTSTEPSLSRMACATSDAGAFFVLVHVPAVKGSWAIAMLHQASASRAIPSVRNTFIVNLTSHFWVIRKAASDADFHRLPTEKSPQGSPTRSPKVGGL